MDVMGGNIRYVSTRSMCEEDWRAISVIEMSNE